MTTGTDSSDEKYADSSGTTNVAQQNAVHTGDTTVHDNSVTNNHYVDSDPPEKKFKTAVHFVRISSFRAAEPILDELAGRGIHSTELLYYHVLAILGGRTLADIDGTMLERYTAIVRTAKDAEPDEWTRAIKVVDALLRAAWPEIERTDVKRDELRGELDELPPRRSEEIDRHLSVLIDAALGERPDARTLARLEEARLCSNRRQRAWKFFEPDPVEPRPVKPRPRLPDAAAGNRLWRGALVLAAGTSVAVAWTSEPRRLGGPALLGVVLLLVSAAVAVWLGSRRQWRALCHDHYAGEWLHGNDDRDEAPISPGHWVSGDFSRKVRNLTKDEFGKAREVANLPPNLADDEPVMNWVAFDVADRYGNSVRQYKATRWVIRCHADRILTQRQHGDVLAAYRSRGGELAGVVAGFAASAGGLAVLVLAQCFVLAVTLAAGGLLCGRGLTDQLGHRAYLSTVCTEAGRREQGERRAFERRRRFLQDRPTDSEMAAWLDADKRLLIATALRDCDLSYQDLLGHVALLQPAREKDESRARVRYGPLRYTSYEILIFLLTGNGVRRVRFRFDFIHVRQWSQHRTSFRYRHLVSATVSQQGEEYSITAGPALPHSLVLRFVDGNEEPIRLDRQSAVDGERPAQAMRSGRRASARIMTMDADRRDAPDNDSKVGDDLTVENSGIRSALRVLETVTAEGEHWTERQRQRRRGFAELLGG